MIPYDFRQQLSIGQEGERRVADWLVSLGRTVRYATRDEQRMGIDFHVSALDGEHFEAVEVKRCNIGHRTGNAHLELIQVDETCGPGWITTCQADWIAYLLWETGRLYWLRPPAIRAAISLDWKNRAGHDIRVVWTPNADGYRTGGWLIPLVEWAQCAEHVVTVP